MADFGFANGLNKSLDHQVRDLRKQLAGISKALSDNGLDLDDLSHDAENLLKGAQKNARRAARNVEKEIDVLSRAAHKAPAGAGTVIAVVALVGFGLGYLAHIAQR